MVSDLFCFVEGELTQLGCGLETLRFQLGVVQTERLLFTQLRLRIGVSLMAGLLMTRLDGLDWTGILKFVFTPRGMQLKVITTRDD